MVEIQRSQQLQAHRFYPLKQHRRSPHGLRLTVEEILRPFPCLKPQKRTPHLSWSDSGTSHISFRGESNSLALQNTSYGVDHLSAELKKSMSKRMRPPRRPRRVCMTKAGLKNHPPKICHEKGNGEWAQGRFLVYEAEFNEARRENPGGRAMQLQKVACKHMKDNYEVRDCDEGPDIKHEWCCELYYIGRTRDRIQPQ